MSNIVRLDAIRSLDLGQLQAAAAYTPIGLVFNHAMRIVHFTNDSNGTYMISFDGTTDNVVVLADSFVLYDFTSDQDFNEKFRFQVGTQLFVKLIVSPTLVASTSNSLYVTCMFGKGE